MTKYLLDFAFARLSTGDNSMCELTTKKPLGRFTDAEKGYYLTIDGHLAAYHPAEFKNPKATQSIANLWLNGRKGWAAAALLTSALVTNANSRRERVARATIEYFDSVLSDANLQERLPRKLGRRLNSR